MEVILSSITNSTSLKINIFEIEELMRKLATIRTIANIKPIPNADRIEVAQIDGWEVIISKSDNFSQGDKVVYIEIDSKMPKTPEYDFLKSRKYVVKTIKLRGQVSQGLVLPLAVLPPGNYKVGDDVTEILGVTKYDPEAEQENAIVAENKKQNPIIKYFMRFKWFRKLVIKRTAKGKFPDWIKKTDEERIQNKTGLFEQLKANKTQLSVTEKVDGTSATYFLKKVKKNKYEFGVCSRNQRLTKEDTSYYWNVARKYKIKEALRKLIGNLDWIVLQGEITGEKIQGNKYPMDGGERFWAFNLISPEGKLTTEEMQRALLHHGIYTVPIFDNEFVIPEEWEISDIVHYVQGKSQIYPREREGCVFRNVEQDISFKCINPEFLIRNDM